MAGIVMGHVLEVMDRPWKWGEADCCTAACDVFLRLTGIDPMASLRGKYATRHEANTIIQAMGGFEAMAVTLAERAGLQPSDGRPGDLAVGCPSGGVESLVICVSPGVYAGKTRTGVVTIPSAKRFYRA
jgi:hypothetical protein